MKRIFGKSGIILKPDRLAGFYLRPVGRYLNCSSGVELVDQIRKNATIDWTVKESVRAKMRVMVKRILTKYNYPPDKLPRAVVTILEQAEILPDPAKDFSIAITTLPENLSQINQTLIKNFQPDLA
jgi:hypothetical protein